METEGATAGSTGMRVPTGSCVILLLFLIERVESLGDILKLSFSRRITADNTTTCIAAISYKNDE